MKGKRFILNIFALTILLSLIASLGLPQKTNALHRTTPRTNPRLELADIRTTRRAFQDFPFGPTDFDSGWMTINHCQRIDHNLGGNPDTYVVDLTGRSANGDTHYGFGGDVWDDITAHGLYWYDLKSNSIFVCVKGSLVKQIRLRIWIVATADYDSGWITPSQGAVDIVLQHNLGGQIDDYWVYLEGWNSGDDDSARRLYYGGERHRWRDSLGEYGLYWKELSPSSITIHRGQDGSDDRFRVRIWRMPEPDYDSGWFSIYPNTIKTLYHNLGGPWNDFFVDLQFRKEGSLSPHHAWYGRDCYYEDGNLICMGGYWTGLTGSRIQVYRAPNDTDADEMRVRIWASRKPKFDSGWRDIDQNEALYLYHNLGGDSDTYVVDVVGKHPAWGINQIGYGGDTVQGVSDLFHVGIAWQNLTNSYLQIYRFPEDDSAHYVRARLWIAPFPDYDSGWRNIAQDGVLTLRHALGGLTDDYVVVLDFKNFDIKGVNQFWYGGDSYYNFTSGHLDKRGAYWYGLDSTYIYVHRGNKDPAADLVRVRIWRNSQADYQSGWRYIGGSSPYVTIEHNLGQQPESMVVDFQYRGTPKVSQHGYGRDMYKHDGATLFRIGAFWSRLTYASILVNRGVNDNSIRDARVRIWLVEPYRIYMPLTLPKKSASPAAAAGMAPPRSKGK